VSDGGEQVRGHLSGADAYQAGLVRFIENHDEPRAAASFPGDKARAAAVVALTQTGARIVHEGQMEGRTTRVPVFLARRPDETADAALQVFYGRLLAALGDGVVQNGRWQLAGTGGWAGNDTWRNLVAWGWHCERRRLVVVNLGDAPASGHVSLAWDELRGRRWRLDDAATGESYQRSGDELHDHLYVALDAWGWHLFTLTPLAPQEA
jgi:hypothetical protein